MSGGGRFDRFQDIIEAAATTHKVDPNLIRAVVEQESLFDPDAISRAGAVGLMQLMPATAADLGLYPDELKDPQKNVYAGTKYLKSLIEKYGEIDRALAAYNAGPGRVDSLIQRYGEKWFDYLPDETKQYVPRIAEKYMRYSQGTVLSEPEKTPEPDTNFFRPSINPPPATKLPLFRARYPQYNSIPDDALIDVIHERFFSQYPIETVREFLIEEYGDAGQHEVKPPGVLGVIGTGIKYGINTIASAISAGVNWVLGDEVFATGHFKRETERLVSGLPQEVLKSIEDDPTLLLNPKWLAFNVSAMLPFTLLTVPAGGGGFFLGAKAASALGGKLLMSRIAGIVGGAAANSVFESFVEAGGAYAEALEAGKDENEADRAAKEVMAENLALNSVINSIEVGKTMKYLGLPITRKIVRKTAKDIVADIGVSSLAEGVQEGLQEIISNVALGRPYNEGLYDSAVLGSISGIFFGGGLEILDNAGKRKSVERAFKRVSKRKKGEGLAKSTTEAAVETSTTEETPGDEEQTETKQVEEKEAELPQLPEFESDEDATRFGAEATPEDIEKLMSRRRQKLDESERLRAKRRPEKALELATSAARDLLAIEEYEKVNRDKIRRDLVPSMSDDDVNKLTSDIIEFLTEDGEDVETTHLVGSMIREIREGGGDDRAVLLDLIDLYDRSIEQSKSLVEKVETANIARPNNFVDTLVSVLPEEQREAVAQIVELMAKADGKSVDEFVKSRALSVRVDEDIKEGKTLFQKALLGLRQSIARAKEYKDWAADGGYKPILDAETNTPLALFHGTHRVFEELSRYVKVPVSSETGETTYEYNMAMDIGWHFGSLSQANDRIMHTTRLSEEFPSNLRVYVARAKRLLRMEDIGDWRHIDAILYHLHKMGLISEKDRQRLLDKSNDIRKNYFAYPEIGAKEFDYLAPIREYIESLGYDGIVYRNEYEGYLGGDSYIFWKHDNIKNLFDYYRAVSKDVADIKSEIDAYLVKRRKFSLASWAIPSISDKVKAGVYKDIEFETIDDSMKVLLQSLREADRIKGATLLSQSQNIIYLFTKETEKYAPSDISTVLEELWHANEPFLSEAQLSVLESYHKKSVSEWDDNIREKNAKMWLKYWKDGVAPNKELKSLFAKIKEFILKVYDSIRDAFGGKIRPEIKELFDSVISRETRVALEERYTQSKILGRYGESPIHGNKILGHIENIPVDEVESVTKSLREFGYSVEEYVRSSGGEPSVDVFYYLNKDEKKAKRAIAYGIRKIQNKITPKQYELYLIATGRSVEEAGKIVRAWRELVDSSVLGTNPADREEVSRIFSREEFIDTVQDESGDVEAVPGISIVKSPSILDEETERDLKKSNHLIYKEIKRLREAGMFDEADRLSSVLDEIRTKSAKKTDIVSADASSVDNLVEDQNRLVQYISILNHIYNERDKSIRDRLISRYNELSNYFSGSGKSFMDFVELTDPDAWELTRAVPRNDEERQSVYEELGLEKEEGDMLSDSDLDSMLESRYKTLFQRAVSSQSVNTDEAVKVARVLENTKLPNDLKSFLKEYGVNRDELGSVADELRVLIGTPQYLARRNPRAFGRIFRMVNFANRIKGKIITDAMDDKYVVGLLKLDRDSQIRVFNTLVEGTTYGLRKPELVPPPSRPWKDAGWWTKEKLEAALKNGQITPQEAENIRQEQKKKRAEYEKALAEWHRNLSSVGKVFTGDELRERGLSEREIEIYYGLRRIMDKLVEYNKNAAIASGMSAEQADAVYSLTGYWVLDRGSGKWGFFYKDPTSPTGYGFARYKSYRAAVADRDAMIDKGLVDPDDEASRINKVPILIRTYTNRITPSMAIDLLDEIGLNVSELEKMINSGNYSEEELESLSIRKDIAQKLIDTVKSKTYSGARTIHRGNVGVIINPENMIDIFQEFVYRTANRYAKAIAHERVNSLVRDIDPRDIAWKNAAIRYVDFNFRSMNPFHSKFWDRFRQFGFLYALAGNVSNAMLNLTQPLLTTLPYLNEWTSNPVIAGKVFSEAVPIALDVVFRGKIPRHVLKKYPLLAQVINELKFQGALAPSFQEEIISANPREKLIKHLTFLQSATEKFNRTHAAIAGYLLFENYIANRAVGNEAISQRISDIVLPSREIAEKAAVAFEPEKVAASYVSFEESIKQAVKSGELSKEQRYLIALSFAREASDTTQFVYGMHNYPVFITSAGILANPLKSSFLFKGFLFNYIGFLSTSKQIDPGFWNSAVHKAVLLGPLLLLAGISGLPFADDLKELLRTLGIVDIDTGVRDIVGSEFYSDLLLKGVPSILPQQVAFDFSRRAGVGGVLPEGLVRGNVYDGIGEFFAGAPASIVSRVTEGISDIIAGDLTIGLRKASPFVIGNIVKSLSMSEQGAVTEKGDLLVPAEKLSTPQILLSAVGFKPEVVSEAEELKRAMSYEEKSRRDRVESFNEKIADAIADGDYDELKEIIDDIVQYNSKVEPYLRYSLKRQREAIRRRILMRTVERANLMYTPSQLRPRYLELEREIKGE